jgi:hypothetical protein
VGNTKKREKLLSIIYVLDVKAEMYPHCNSEKGQLRNAKEQMNKPCRDEETK